MRRRMIVSQEVVAMNTKPYGMICPITKACEMLEPRWTIPILTELWSGSTRFNDLRRGIGNISPTLLSRRLKELEAFGLVERIEDPAAGTVDYIRTQKAIELEPALNALSIWAQRHIEAESALCDVNLSALMWKMRRYILTDELPKRRLVIRFHFSDDAEYDTYWALIQPGVETEICTAIPGYDIDLYVETTVRSLSAILLARSTVAREIEAGRLFLSGDALLARTMQRWISTTDSIPDEGAAALYPEEKVIGNKVVQAFPRQAISG